MHAAEVAVIPWREIQILLYRCRSVMSLFSKFLFWIFIGPIGGIFDHMSVGGGGSWLPDMSH